VAKRTRRYVFISYSSADKAAAEAVCAGLEAARISCFLAHRDNKGGVLWDESLLDALDDAAALVLLLSANANGSAMVKREVERASSRETPIVPFRIEDVPPGRSLEFFIKIHHWLNAFPPPVGQHLPQLVDSLRFLFRGARKENDKVSLYPYMVARGPAAHEAFVARPAEPWDGTIRGTETIEDLRTKLLMAPVQIAKPIKLSVQGVLFPCALLSSGWWEKRKESKTRQLPWRDGLQEWLFHGFDLWGPSWDFSWDFDRGEGQRPYSIAQVGDGDEANSLPVLLPHSKARRLKEVLGGEWGGVQATVHGVLGHRSHFAQYVDPGALALFGGLLDYCLWLDEDDPNHKIVVSRDKHTAVYSGYIWKCVAPKQLVLENTPVLSDVYFLWEHANWTSKDAISFSLEALNNKEEQLRRRWGELVLLQKSSSLVAGTPLLSKDAVYDMLVGKSEITI
jgi:hypothetical protein